jgi:hypothetical protein
MKPITTGALIGTEVVLGEWATGKSLGVKEAVAAPIVIIGLMFLDKLDARLGQSMSVLVLVVVSIYWLPRILQKVDLYNGPIPKYMGTHLPKNRGH